MALTRDPQLRLRSTTRWLLLLGVIAIPWVGAQEPETIPDSAEPQILGKRSTILAPDAEAGETIRVEEGTRLYALPDRRSSLSAIVDTTAEREVLERVEDWVRIRFEGQDGWAVARAGRAEPTLRAPAATDYLTATQLPLTPLPQRLDMALTILDGGEGRQIGPFTIHSDLADRRTLELVDTLAHQLPEAYARRYGVAAAERDRFAVVVFASEASYRRFERTDAELAELAASGHAAGNVAAIFAEGRRRDELPPILLHEMAHLLNQSAFRSALPAWLEEGLAEDLSFSRVESSGRLDPSRLGGLNRRSRLEMSSRSETVVTRLWGAPASLTRLSRGLRAGELMALPDLMSLDQREMIRIEGRPLRYAQSAFFVRFLLDGAGKRGRDALREFLRQVAEGSDAEPERLRVLLDEDWNRVSSRYSRWLITQTRALEAG